MVVGILGFDYVNDGWIIGYFWSSDGKERCCFILRQRKWWLDGLALVPQYSCYNGSSAI